MIDQQLLDILVCPETHQPVSIATPELLEQVNAAIAAGEVVNRAGSPVETALTDALVREDQTVIYAIRNDIPIMLIDESIEWKSGAAGASEE